MAHAVGSDFVLCRALHKLGDAVGFLEISFSGTFTPLFPLVISVSGVPELASRFTNDTSHSKPYW
jgi:hypothetical protein